MPATIVIHKIKAKSPKGKWFTAEIIDHILLKNGTILLIPQNEKYQHLKILLHECIIIK